MGVMKSFIEVGRWLMAADSLGVQEAIWGNADRLDDEWMTACNCKVPQRVEGSFRAEGRLIIHLHTVSGQKC